MEEKKDVQYTPSESPSTTFGDPFPNHTHDGLNSLKIKQTSFITMTTIGGGVVFNANRKCVVKSISEVHAVTATGTTYVEKLTSGQAVTTGTAMAGFPLSSSRDVVVIGTLSNPGGVALSEGDRIGSWVDGSSAGLSYQCITIEIEYV